MSQDKTDLSINVQSNIPDMEEQLEKLKDLADDFGKSLTDALKDATINGKNFQSVMNELILSFSDKVLDNALDGLFSPIGNIVGDLLGGVVSSPALFPTGTSPSSFGSMGGGGSNSASSNVNVTFNISTPDVDGFSRSETQISTMLARAVNRGWRGL